MKHSILFSLFLLILGSCSKSSGIIMIDQSREVIIEKYCADNDYDIYFNKKKYISQDTIIVGIFQGNQPMETMYLFRDNICYHQESNIYCSSCAEKTIQYYIKNKKYKFRKIDNVNYISKKHKDVIMRIKNIGSEEHTCAEIKVIKLSKPLE